MKRTAYTNRYGDEIIFEEIAPKKVKMSGFDFYRGSDEFIDPSGGPFIQKGTDVGRYFNDKEVRRVGSISIEENNIYLIIE